MNMKFIPFNKCHDLYDTPSQKVATKLVSYFLTMREIVGGGRVVKTTTYGNSTNKTLTLTFQIITDINKVFWKILIINLKINIKEKPYVVA